MYILWDLLHVLQSTNFSVLAIECTFYDDVMTWKHLSHYWPFVRGIHRSRARNAELCRFLCRLTNTWVADDLRHLTFLWRHCNVWTNLHPQDLSQAVTSVQSGRSVGVKDEISLLALPIYTLGRGGEYRMWCRSLYITVGILLDT